MVKDIEDEAGIKWQDRDSDGSEGGIKKRREGEDREEKVFLLFKVNGSDGQTGWWNSAFTISI